MHFNRLIFIPMLCAPLAAVAEPQSCLVEFEGYQNEEQVEPGHIHVKASKTVKQLNQAIFEGNVDVLSDTSLIHADQASIDTGIKQLVASGDVQYSDQQIRVSSDNVLLNTDSGKLELNNNEYHMAQVSGRGSAGLIKLDKETGIELQEVSFTTCPKGEEDWKIVASSITLEEGENWGEARNTRFYLGGVPVFYLPYFAFPVNEQRQTGLLYPQLSTNSSTGPTYEQAFYWNIAPNYDATFTPRFMANRGIQIKTEFRYLTEQHQGQLNLEYLGNDRETGISDDRYFYRYVHSGDLSANWHLYADINGLSDDNYLVDLGSEFYNRADTHLFQTLGLNYFANDWDVSISFKDFEVIGDRPSTYRALPEIKLSYAPQDLQWVEFRFDSELAYFENTQPDAPKAARFHVAPSLTLPYRAQWGEFLAQATLLNTYYRQENIEGTGLAEEVNRTLGRARLYGTLNFERPTNWLGEEGMTQTLEPKIQYLYTSYEDQSQIGLYDTTRLLNNFEGLFRGQEFTGLDRISDNNQVTVGITTRILDKNHREQFRLSLGQIFYLERNEVLEASKEDDRSALAAELDWQIGSRWYTHSELQVSTSTDKVERSSLALEYRLSQDKIVQFNHRFVRALSNERINQFGVTASWPLSKNWHWVGRWYKDTERNRTIESYSALQYESCCWSLAVVVQRNLINRFDAGGLQSTDEFESSIGLKFSFRGMGGSSGSRDLLEDGLFGYRQPYLFN